MAVFHQAVQFTVAAVFIVVFFGLSIFFHELGHLLAALWRGMHVDRFSVGFGKAIWSKRWRGIDFIIGFLPFGGFVALPQMDPGDRPHAADGVPLAHARPMDRIIVALAGPLCNIIFGLVLATAIWIIGINGPRPQPYFIIGHIAETYQLDGKSIPTPEYAAGLREGDKVVAINGVPLSNAPLRSGWADAFKQFVFASGPLKVTYERNGVRGDAVYEMARNPETEQLFIPFMSPRTTIQVAGITENSPAASSAIKTGDYIMTVNGIPPVNAQGIIDAVRASGSTPVELAVDRPRGDGTCERVIIHDLVPIKMKVGDEVNYMIGLRMEPATHPSERVRLHPTPKELIADFVSDMAMMFVRLADHNNPISPGHMSSAVGIVHSLWNVVNFDGIMHGIKFMVLINVNLAIINLVPFPVLDGGHISFAILEMITRKRVPARVSEFLQLACAILLISFVLYVTYRDGLRVKRSFDNSQAEPAAPEPVPVPVEAGTAAQGEPRELPLH